MSLVVIAVCSAISFLLGVVIGVHNVKTKELEYDGTMVVTIPSEGKKLFSLELDGDPEDLVRLPKKSVVFKIVANYPEDDDEIAD